MEFDIKNFEEILKEAKVEWRVRKFKNADDYKKNLAYEDNSFEGNIMLNEGINELWTILCSAGGTKFDNGNAYLGVGNGTATESAAHTDLQGASKTYVAMESGFPTFGTAQKATWKASFGAAVANYAWAEFTVANGDSGASKNLNRKVSAQGTKTSGQTWELQLEITLS